MNASNMKNIVVLKNLPSNLIEEAIVVFKENKKVKKYQYIDAEKNVKENKTKKTTDNSLEEKNKYIVKEAEMVISNYISKIETQSPKSKHNVKKLENKYRKSLKLNFVLGFATVISIILSLI